MRLSNNLSTWILSLFLIAPTAWGETTGDAPERLQEARATCRQELGERLRTTGRLSSFHRYQLALALCEDERIFWPFAEGRFGWDVIQFEESFRTRLPYGPLVLGLQGASRREATDVADTVRSLLYPLSDSVLPWNGDRHKLREWRIAPNGGEFGGVLLVRMPGETEAAVSEDVKQANEAMTFAIASHMDSHVLVLNSVRDVQDRFPKSRRPIRWIDFESRDCDRQLRF